MANSPFRQVPRRATAKKESAAKSAWDDAASGFRSSSFGREYQKVLDAYEQKRSDFLKQKGWSEDSLSQSATEPVKKKHGFAGLLAIRQQKSSGTSTKTRGDVLQDAVGSAPGMYSYYEQWQKAGSPGYVDDAKKVDSSTRDGPAQDAPSGDGGSAKKGYDLSGRSSGGRRYAPSADTDAGSDGVGSKQTSEGGGSLGNPGEGLKKRFKPLGK